MIVNRNFVKMPLQIDFIRKSLNNLYVRTFLVFAIVVLLGHLSINFWERFTLQSELTNMKHSLHLLKDTITNIGKAYDDLHTELKDLIKIVDDRQRLRPECKHKRDAKDRCKTEPSIEHRKLNDIQVQTVVTKSSGAGPRILMISDKQTGHDGPEYKRMNTIHKNAATNTKNPPKSVGVMSDLSKLELERHPLNEKIHHHSYNHLDCNKNYELSKNVCQCGKSETNSCYKKE
ncbi:hypothetical protein HW555_007337 [Spodoptera exigua]|uniref:Uncharacterized protein n=1 Tax=Spodoptera exigua TaxID=7107 RepID=A0A835GGG8_SPOEX|nr:hypothetical protein HW555_007337 [Spodoptera exigua]